MEPDGPVYLPKRGHFDVTVNLGSVRSARCIVLRRRYRSHLRQANLRCWPAVPFNKLISGHSYTRVIYRGTFKRSEFDIFSEVSGQ